MVLWSYLICLWALSLEAVCGRLIRQQFGIVSCSGGRLMWSYVLVAYGLMFLWLTAPGRLLLGCSNIVEDAHITAVGNVIRMVCHHFLELRKCPAAKSVAFRKVR